MHVEPAPGNRRALVRSDALASSLIVSGLPARELATLLRGECLAALWRPGLALEVDCSTASGASSTGPSRQIDLADGRVGLTSGGPGRLVVEPRHTLDNTVLPQSLYLLLAQQWARAGVLMVHGAAFEFDRSGVLALGARGGGKSVLTAAALLAGARVVSDDWVLVGCDPNRQLVAERLRRFLMLRRGWAGQTLLEALIARGARATPAARKWVLALDKQPAGIRNQLLTGAALDQIWLLRRPTAARAVATSREPVGSAEVFAGLIQATMPLLFAKPFKIESAMLVQTARSLVSRLERAMVTPGSDIVASPESAIEMLVAKPAAMNKSCRSKPAK